VKLLQTLNERLAATGDALQTELKRPRFRADNVLGLIRQVNLYASSGVTDVQGLGGKLGPNEPGGQMAALYRQMVDSASKTLDASVNNNPEAYRRGALALAGMIAKLPPLQRELEKLAVPPTPAPSSAPPSPTPTPIPTKTPAPTATPTPTGTPAPSGNPTESLPIATGPEQLTNGGFEDGVDQPWQLFLGPGAAATLAGDPAEAGAGASSARIDITSGSLAYAGISLRQAGLSLEPGQQYALTVSMRSTAIRDVRVRIASSASAQYFGRIVSATPQWSSQTFVFTAGVGDPNAVLELDLGRAEATTWFDGVSFRAVGS